MTGKGDARAHLRANVFLNAALDTGGQAFAVRVRNMSANGALLESAGLPEEGIAVRLRRGSLMATGKVAWRIDELAGIRFDIEVDVPTWIKGVEHDRQARVDRTIDLLRRDSRGADGAGMPNQKDSLPLVSADLNEVCEGLANTPEAVQEFPDKLLQLETIAQRLRNLLNT